MFKRREPLTITQTARQFFWPSMGLKRSIIYIKHRLLRVSDSPHKIALGLAIGFGVSFTPLLGTHFIQAGIFALLLRGNIFSAMIGTFIGNPWTFPFFWWAGFSFGSFLFSVFGFNGADQLPSELDLHLMWEIIKTHPMTLFLPWMLGGYILAVATMPLTYGIYYYIISAAKKARAKAISLRKKDSVKISQ
tara:strand:- start:538 stop:1110 length:573 start_codon:yes stop_codon:yes gene_type:complete